MSPSVQPRPARTHPQPRGDADSSRKQPQLIAQSLPPATSFKFPIRRPALCRQRQKPKGQTARVGPATRDRFRERSRGIWRACGRVGLAQVPGDALERLKEAQTALTGGRAGGTPADTSTLRDKFIQVGLAGQPELGGVRRWCWRLCECGCCCALRQGEIRWGRLCFSILACRRGRRRSHDGGNGSGREWRRGTSTALKG